MPASAFRAQQDRIRELERLLGRKTMEVEIPTEALDVADDSKQRPLWSLSLPKGGSR